MEEDNYISEEEFDIFFFVLEEFVEFVNPEDIVSTLEDLLDPLVNTSDYLLDNNTNTEVHIIIIIMLA